MILIYLNYNIDGFMLRDHVCHGLPFLSLRPIVFQVQFPVACSTLFEEYLEVSLSM